MYRFVNNEKVSFEQVKQDASKVNEQTVFKCVFLDQTQPTLSLPSQDGHRELAPLAKAGTKKDSFFTYAISLSRRDLDTQSAY